MPGGGVEAGGVDQAADGERRGVVRPEDPGDGVVVEVRVERLRQRVGPGHPADGRAEPQRAGDHQPGQCREPGPAPVGSAAEQRPGRLLRSGPHHDGSRQQREAEHQPSHTDHEQRERRRRGGRGGPAPGHTQHARADRGTGDHADRQHRGRAPGGDPAQTGGEADDQTRERDPGSGQHHEGDGGRPAHAIFSSGPRRCRIRPLLRPACEGTEAAGCPGSRLPYPRWP